MSRTKKTVKKKASRSPHKGEERERDQAVGTPVELPTYNDLSSVADVRERILSASENTDRLIVDCSKVERMDTSTIQVLVAARESFAKEDVDFVFVAPSEIMISAFDDLGLAKEVRMWSV